MKLRGLLLVTVLFLLGFNLMYRYEVAKDRVQNPEHYRSTSEEVFDEQVAVVARGDETLQDNTPAQESSQTPETEPVDTSVVDTDSDRDTDTDQESPVVREKDSDNEHTLLRVTLPQTDTIDTTINTETEQKRVTPESITSVLDSIMIDKVAYPDKPATKPVYPVHEAVLDKNEDEEAPVPAEEYVDRVYTTPEVALSEGSVRSTEADVVIPTVYDVPMAPSATTALKIYMYDNGMNSSQKRITKGPVVMTVQNLGKRPHGISVSNQNKTSVQHYGRIQPGQSRNLSMTLEPGVWTVYSAEVYDTTTGVTMSLIVE